MKSHGPRYSKTGVLIFLLVGLLCGMKPALKEAQEWLQHYKTTGKEPELRGGVNSIEDAQ